MSEDISSKVKKIVADHLGIEESNYSDISKIEFSFLSSTLN